VPQKHRNIKKDETIIRIQDSQAGRKRFRAIIKGEQASVKRALTPLILGPGGPKVGESVTRPSSEIYDSKGIEFRGTFSQRKRARIRLWGTNRDPRKYPSRIGTKKKT